MKRGDIKYYLSEQGENYGSGNTWHSEGFCWGRAAEAGVSVKGRKTSLAHRD